MWKGGCFYNPYPIITGQMNVRTPSFQQHPTGQWFTKWGGKFHYFGQDREPAYEKYLANVVEWAEWRKARKTQRFLPPTKAFSVIKVIELFLNDHEVEGGIERRRYYEKHLARFSAAFGTVRVDVIRVTALHAIKRDMQVARYAAKTINHDLIAIKGMLNWAVDREMIPPVQLRGCKTLPLGPPEKRALPIARIFAMLCTSDTNMRSWLAINYLALMRPTEVIRVVHNEGDWTEPGVFRLDRGKIDTKARYARHVVFTPEALSWLSTCKPVWSRLDSYSQAVRKVCGHGGPHPLRHSGATHLARAGVARADIDLLLGHMPARVSLTYAPIVWQPLRDSAARITLNAAALDSSQPPDTSS